MKVQTLHFLIFKLKINSKRISTSSYIMRNILKFFKDYSFFSLIRYKFLPLAPSIFETFSFGEWVVTHSLENTNFHGHLLAVLMKIYSLWDLEWGKNLAHLTGCSEQPASPVLLTRNGPLGAKCIKKEIFNLKSI